MRLLVLCTLVGLTYGCRTTGSTSSVKEEGTSAPAPKLGIDILENKPAVSQIPQDVEPETDWAFDSGREYWLYSSRGRYVSFSARDKYAPYQNSQACEGRTEDPNSACSVKPSKVAQACQYTASLTLKALMENEPQEYTELKQKYGGGFSLFGWMNDAHSDADYAVRAWQEPFIWRGSAAAIQIDGDCPADFKSVSGYVKWVSSVDKNGVCKTPSKGQFLALMKKARECLEKNNSQPSN